MMRSTRAASLTACLSTLALLLPVDRAAADLIPDEPSPAWREAPVRYILTVGEDAEYKTLATDEARRVFIERFWAALDPTPGTGINERRLEFWKRVDEVERLFRESLAPGFKSDRGKVYILMGPPDGRNQHGSEETWTYVALKRANAVPEIQIHFRRTSEGEYRMRPGDLVYRDPLARGGGVPAGGWYLAFGPEGASPQIMEGRIRMVDFPKGEVRADDFFGDLAFRSRIDATKAERGATRLLMTLAMPRGQFHDPAGVPIVPDVNLSVQIEDLSGDKPVGRVTEIKLIDTPARQRAELAVLVQAAFSLRPGSYRAVLTLYDRQTHLGTRVARAIEAPDLSRGLALSSIMVGRLPEDEGGATGPFQNGMVAFAPEPDPIFRPSETVTFAYQVYGGRQRRGQTDLEVEYRFSRKEGQELHEIGKAFIVPHVKQPSIGYALPLAGWPPGDYRIMIRVRDTHGGAEATGQGEFRIPGEMRSPG